MKETQIEHFIANPPWSEVIFDAKRKWNGPGAAFYGLRMITNIRQIGEEKNLRDIWYSMLFYHEQNLRGSAVNQKCS